MFKSRRSVFDDASPSRWSKYLGGVFIPLALIIYGVFCIKQQRGFIPYEYGVFEVVRLNAIAFGLVCVSLGSFLHTHYFWGNSKLLERFSNCGMCVSLLVFIGALGFLLVKILVFSFGYGGI